MEKRNILPVIFSDVNFHSCTYANQSDGEILASEGAELVLLFVLRGSVCCGDVRAGRSEILIAPAGRSIHGNAAECYAVWMRAGNRSEPGEPVRERPQGFDRLLFQVIQLMYYSVHGLNGTSLTFELLIQELQNPQNLQAAVRNQHMEKAFLWIEQNYRRNYSLEELARALGYVPSYFCRMFRKNTEMTPGEYQSALRIRDACVRLAETDDVLSVIAHELGYSSDKHFMTVFKKHMRVTPTQYRNACRR